MQGKQLADTDEILDEFRASDTDHGDPMEAPSGADEKPLTATERYSLSDLLLTVCRGLRSVEHAIDTNDTGQARLVCHIDEFLQARMEAYRNNRTSCTSPIATSNSSSKNMLPMNSLGNDNSEFYKLAALASLSETLQTASPVAFLGITVFAFLEVVSDAPFGQWQRHLRGARSLLDYHCRDREEFSSLSCRVTGLTEMVVYLAWWDTIGTIIRRLSGSYSDDDNELIFLDWHRDVIDDDFFGVVGCPAETFQLFVMLAKSSSSSDEITGSKSKANEYIQIMGQLLAIGSDASEQGRCRDAWKCVAAIAVISLQSPDSESQIDQDEDVRRATIDIAVDRICKVLDSTCPASRLYIHMATAAFIAGINATSSRHCEVLRTYWHGCQVGEHPRYWEAFVECERRWRSKGIM